LISRLKIIFAVIIYVSCGLSVESCGVLRCPAVFRHTAGRRQPTTATSAPDGTSRARQ